ncbi:MAG TPA: lipase secretion chaperone [Pseudomonadales bacterium]|nr:lipase secretion chaperone [Pseudomonadales bacterium]
MHKRLLLAGMGGVFGALWLAFTSFNAWDNTPVNQLPAKLVANFHNREAIQSNYKSPLRPPPVNFKTGLENLSPGVPLKGALEVDSGGHLLVNANVRRVFDFFLTAADDAPFEQAVARMRAYIDSKLPASAAQEAQQVLEAYLALKQAVDESHYFSDASVQEDSLGVQDLLVRKKELTALREKYLGAETTRGFFAEDEAFDDFCILRKQILQETNTLAQDKAKRIAALESALSDTQRYAYNDNARKQDLARLTEQWANERGSAADLRQIRISLLGQEMAAVLETQDKENAQWDIRIANWLDQRNKLLHDQATPEVEKNARLDFIRSTQFTFEEIPRVKAEEHLRDYAFAK